MWEEVGDKGPEVIFPQLRVPEWSSRETENCKLPRLMEVYLSRIQYILSHDLLA